MSALSVYHTSDSAELITQIMLNNKKVVGHALAIGEVANGTILDICDEFQVTNDLTKPVMISARLWLSPAQTITIGTDGLPVGCTPLNQDNCTNVTPEPGQHHYTVSKNAKFQAPRDMGNSFVLLVVHAEADSLPATTFLSVNRGNGSLQVIKTSP